MADSKGWHDRLIDGVIGWAKSNPVLASVLALAGAIGYLIDRHPALMAMAISGVTAAVAELPSGGYLISTLVIAMAVWRLDSQLKKERSDRESCDGEREELRVRVATLEERTESNNATITELFSMLTDLRNGGAERRKQQIAVDQDRRQPR